MDVPASPGVGIRRKGPKALPTLPLIHPESIVDAHVVLSDGDVSLATWKKEAGKELSTRIGGIVLSIPNADLVASVKESDLPILSVVVPLALESATHEPLAATSLPVSFSTTYSKTTSETISSLTWALNQAKPVDIDVGGALSESAFEQFEELLSKAAAVATSAPPIVVFSFPPPHDLSLSIVKLMKHPTYREFQSQTAALSLHPNLYIKFLPPMWDAPTPAAPPNATDSSKEVNEWKRRVKMYLGPVMEAFGYQRIIFGSSPSPASKSASVAGDWYGIARESLAELNVEQEFIDAVFCENAKKVDVRPEIGRRNADDSSSSRESSPIRKPRSFTPASDDEPTNVLGTSQEPVAGADDATPPPENAPLIRQSLAFGAAFNSPATATNATAAPLIRQAVGFGAASAPSSATGASTSTTLIRQSIAFSAGPSATPAAPAEGQEAPLIRQSLGFGFNPSTTQTYAFQPPPTTSRKGPKPVYLPGQVVPQPPKPPKPPRKKRQEHYPGQITKFRVDAYVAAPEPVVALPVDGPYTSLYRAKIDGQDLGSKKRAKTSEPEAGQAGPGPSTAAQKGKAKASTRTARRKQQPPASDVPVEPQLDSEAYPEPAQDFNTTTNPTPPQAPDKQLRLVTILMEDVRNGADDPESQLAEVRVSLRVNSNVEDGWWALGDEICRALQSTGSRIDGPAKVSAWRGRFKQTILRVNEFNEDVFIECNVVVKPDRTLDVIVENLAPTRQRPQPPAEQNRPSHKRRHSPSDDSDYNRPHFTPERRTPSTLRSSPGPSNHHSRASPSPAIYHPRPPSSRHELPHSSISTVHPVSEVESDEDEVNYKQIVQEVDAILQADDEEVWSQYFQQSGRNHLSARCNCYRIVNDYFEKWVGKRTPSGEVIRETHILGALQMKDEEEEARFKKYCRSIGRLLALYGPQGQRLVDPEVVQMTKDTTIPGYGQNNPESRLLERLRALDDTWRDSDSAYHRHPSRSYPTARSTTRDEYEMAPAAGPSHHHDSDHDYTEGATATDIENAVSTSQRSRRESQYSALYGDDDEDGTMFSGPGKYANPSSTDTEVLQQDTDIEQYSEDEGDYDGSDEDVSQERWGYSSGEDFSDENDSRSVDTGVSIPASMAYDSDPPSPNTGPGLPLLASDQIFGGETRIDMDMSLALSDEPPPGPPSRQTIYIPDEDNTIRFVGYQIVRWRHWLWKLGCVVTFGSLGLLGHWFPRLWLGWVARESAFQQATDGFVVVESAYRDITLFRIRTLRYPYPISTVFASNVDASASLSNLGTLVVVDYRYNRFALDPRTGLFSMIRDWRDQSGSTDGVGIAIRQQRLTLFGKNEVEIEGKSTIALLVDEVIHPFYVFQIASIVLWSLDNYYYYAFCIFLISIISITTTLIETKKTIARMREMSRFSCDVEVLSGGTWLTRESSELVPGDVVNISGSQLSSLIPADMFLLSGDAIVNESMLTGESVPVSKTPAKEEDLARWRESKSETARSFLYAGTRVVRIRGAFSAESSSTQPALAIVARTGFNTTKGALIRSMLYPKPIGFKFYRDSVRFIGVLAGIAGIGFCFSAVQFVRIGVKWQTIIIRALDLITVVVPPALPATLSIGTSFAIGRLRKNGVFCISPSRVNVGGKINVCCFDKTGTLTEDGLDILGVRSLDRNEHRFGELVDDVHDLPLGKDKATFLHALATCHSLKMVDSQVIGDPLDVKMFEFTRWTLEEGRISGTGVIKAKSGAVVEQTALVQTVVRPPGSAQFKLEDALKGNAKRAYFLELGVIRAFDFMSSLRRMSVVVKRLKSTSMEIYCKGAPEVMAEICDPDSFPVDYADLLSYYTKRGYRVIAIAGKSVEGLSWLKAQRMKREQAESGLRFLGLIIFENKLKPGTAPAIAALRSAHLACRMITGDNPLTAVSVARECGLISPASHVFSPGFIRGNETTAASSVEWTSMDEPTWKLDEFTLKPLTAPADVDEIDHHDYSLVVTGDVFRWFISYAPLETLQRMLVKTQIFARMSPDEKNEVVERLQSLGYTVLMCGDGANDCAALKAADVGISLSEAEASVAAPFTASTPDISCVIEVIKEGRAALVTSFSCFKYMALYSMIQFTTVTLLYSFASSLGDFQFLYIDLFVIIPVAVTNMFAFRALAILFLLHTVYAAPVLVNRQENSDGTTTLMTQQTTQTAAGTMTQTCVITLTPITDDNGNPAVRQVKTCTVTMGAAGSNNGSSGTTDSSSTTTTTTADSADSTETTTTSSTDSTETTTASSTGGSESEGGNNGAVSANGVSTVAVESGSAAATAASSSASTTASAEEGAGGGAAVKANGVSTVSAPANTGAAAASASASATSGADTSANNGAQAAAAEASPSSSQFSVPGQKIQVLPIGLGVFAGISVIALIVVGLVTYERTKYRKAFRARKLAESGAAMGYGGMAQR
ncbi:Cation-transporting ATPase [Mycena kentingensis (nom. inval.)]|nr:Cation-transporting ATPase [Mycena kentingensis (nom. inval.)]